MEVKYPEIPDYIKALMESETGIDEILFDREGRWFHNGEKFINERIINFFNKSIAITADGQYVLHYGNYTYPIVVEDVPYFITGVIFDGFGPFERIFINLSSGESEELNCLSLYYRSNNALYCRIKNGTMPARFMRSPSFNILERLEEGPEGKFFLRICGQVLELKLKD